MMQNFRNSGVVLKAVEDEPTTAEYDAHTKSQYHKYRRTNERTNKRNDQTNKAAKLKNKAREI